jgi:RNA polymerase sigma factor (TIGR02999 family)
LPVRQPTRRLALHVDPPVREVTHILQAIQRGEPQAADQLLPLVYNELRRLARGRLSNERPGQTLQATALVHEAYLRLIASEDDRGWENRRHFFGAAAEAMRRILVERARRRARLRHGGGHVRQNLQEDDLCIEEPVDDVLAIHAALDALERIDPRKAELVKLRYFAGLSEDEAANALSVSRATASRWWTFARAWLYERVSGDTTGGETG